MSVDFPLLNSLHITSYFVCSTTLFLCHIGISAVFGLARLRA